MTEKTVTISGSKKTQYKIKKNNKKYNIKRASIIANKANITNSSKARIIKSNKKNKRKKKQII